MLKKISNNFYKKKLGVTLIELLIALSILGIGLTVMVNMINGGTKSVDRMRQEVVAINLAREGMEGVYNIRNTNRIRRAGVKDKCWLKIDPLQNQGNDNDCSNDERMQKKFYILGQKEKNGQKYFVLSGTNVTGLNMSYFDKGIDDKYSLCYTGGKRKACPGQMKSRSEGRFFRQIEGKGLFRKDVETEGGKFLTCTRGTDTADGISCGDKTAKEFRFCSKVQYFKRDLGTVELCGTLNNFEK